MGSSLSTNHFELLGLPVTYTVAQDLLTRHYRELLQSVHPDRFANAPDQERRISMQHATQINEAYRTLRDPLLRARYLLQLKGLEWDDETSTVMDPAFLMEQMELREALAEVRDKAAPLDEVAMLLDDVRQRIQALIDGLTVLFDRQGDTELEQGREMVRKLQFLYKLREEARALEADLEDADTR